MQQTIPLKRMEFLLDLWTLFVQSANNRETNMGLLQRNKLKTTYTPSAAIMVDCVSWGAMGQGIPMRRCELVHTGSQSADSNWGHVTSTWDFHKVMQKHQDGGYGHQFGYNSTDRRVGYQYYGE